MTKTKLLVACVVVGGVLGWLAARNGAFEPTLETARVADESPKNERVLAPAASKPPSEPAGSPSSGEAPPRDPGSFSLARLRQLWVTAPEEALAEAEVLENETTNGDERGEVRWIRTRALVSLGRFSEARTVALAMKREAPNSTFTVDVERHLLVHPLGLPARDERGAR